MTDEALTIIDDINRVQLSAGDVLIVKVRPGLHLTASQSELVSERVGAYFPGHRVLVLDGDLDLQVISTADDEVEKLAEMLFNANRDAKAAPWPEQWRGTKEHWREVARGKLHFAKRADPTVSAAVAFANLVEAHGGRATPLGPSDRQDEA